jgi:hypothetical protein
MTATTVTVAVAETKRSAVEVATTWNVPSVPGAAYSPLALTVPPPASVTVQTTVVTAEPVTAAVSGRDPSAPMVALDGSMVTATPEAATSEGTAEPPQAVMKTAAATTPRRGTSRVFVIWETFLWETRASAP